MVKLVIIGAGNVGSQIGYEVASRDLVEELCFMDINEKLAKGQAADIQQGLAFSNNTKVGVCTADDVKDADIIVITAGKPRTPDIKSRLELAKINAKIVSNIVYGLRGFEGIFITLTNPMDLMNYVVYKEARLTKSKIIGSGGQLDSSRFRIVLSKMLNTPVTEIEAFVLGEHGDLQVPVFSKVRINGESVDFTEEEKAKIMEELKNTALDVITNKGATVYAPASNTVDMIQAILNDEKTLVAASAVLEGQYGLEDVSIGVPVILGETGIEKIEEWGLSFGEKTLFDEGVQKLKSHIAQMMSSGEDF